MCLSSATGGRGDSDRALGACSIVLEFVMSTGLYLQDLN